MRGKGKGVFKIRFYFLLSYSDLMSNKFNQFPQVKSVLPVLVTGYLSLALLWPMSFSLYFLSPGQLRRGRTEWLWGHLVSSHGQPTRTLLPVF